jgi:hypothetical protein
MKEGGEIMIQDNNGNSVSLKEYLENLINNKVGCLGGKLEDFVKLNQEQHNGTEKAIKIATEALNVRLEAMNEFRSAMQDQSSKFISIIEYRSAHESLNKEITTLKDNINKEISTLKDNLSKDIDDLKVDVNNKISELMQSKSNLEGKASQTGLMIVGAFAIINLIITVVALIQGFIK